MELSTTKPQMLPDLMDTMLMVDKVLAAGRFGVVCRGQMSDDAQPVVLKLFSAGHKGYFINEREVYDWLCNCGHTSYFVMCLAALEGVALHDQPQGCLLIQSFAEHGSLSQYLENHAITSWAQLCRMMSGIANGMAALHNALQVTICHRNVTSSNILVKSDLTCCLSDFSLAVTFNGNAGSRPEMLSATDLKASYEHASIRYVAPEVLDGSLNLMDLKSALCQADMYSLGLVLWEICRRCSDLYQGAEVPDFELAYHRELQTTAVSWQPMQILVAKNRARPLFPVVWKNSNPAIQLLKESIEDSWDPDGEARVTASCVSKRLSELPHLWRRYKSTTNLPQTPLNNHNLIVLTNLQPPANTLHNHSMDQHKSGLLKNVNVHSKQQPLAKIQPYQGVNPCSQRNQMCFYSNEQLAAPLMERSAKHQPTTTTATATAASSSPFSSSSISSAVVPAFFSADNPDSSSGGSGRLSSWPQPESGASRREAATPIAFVRNVLHDDAATPANSHDQQHCKKNHKNQKKFCTSASGMNKFRCLLRLDGHPEEDRAATAATSSHPAKAVIKTCNERVRLHLHSNKLA